MLSDPLRGVDRPVLSAGTPEGDHQVSKSSVDVALHVPVNEWVDIVEERGYLAILLQEFDDRFVQPVHVVVPFKFAGVVNGATVEHVSPPLPEVSLGIPFL